MTSNILSAPHFLWELYVDYLWKYKQESWVASIASTCRVLAFLCISPFVVLTLLDVISYVIARTLGVIDDTKAATSEDARDEKPDGKLSGTPAPIIRIHEDDSASSSGEERDLSIPRHPPPAYFQNPVEGEGNLKLAGTDVFSPAPSQPPSPTLSRRDLASHNSHPQLEKMMMGRARGESISQLSSVSTASLSSFVMLDKDSGAEDASVQVRQRRGRGIEGSGGLEGSE
ncbi:hypothetical protein QCA50_004192 [Cerrena zonata]|uniref:Uncharacterized protein n=1 Tax=Cerrena zonata TaxID=2478898 RepID=A0AAW0GRF0_9APHY